MIDASNLALSLLTNIVALIPSSPFMFVFGVFFVCSAVAIFKELIS